MRAPVVFITLAMAAVCASCTYSNGTLYDEAVDRVIAMADKALESGIDIPRPTDAVGGEGYARMTGQRDFLSACGTAYRLTSDRKYADWVSDILAGYAGMYPSLDYHPEGWRTEEPGRLYWQVLEDSMWIFYAAGSYLEVRDGIDAQRRDLIENSLFRPAADFLMYGTEDNTKNNFVFNRMHNHGTWQDAAVGTVGLAVGDTSLVRKSLLGTDLGGEHGGLLQQLDCLFSPDGYYMEGTVYQSYALIPFLRYGMLLRREMPEFDYLDRNDCILAKSADAVFGLSSGDGFFRLNDCCPKTFGSSDILQVLPYIYYLNPDRKWLLSIIRDHCGEVGPDEAGLSVSRDIAAGLAEPFVPRSCIVTDGPDGKKGATMVLRAGTASGKEPVVYMKACGQGSYHGHFDKLTVGYYDNGNEILTEYGSARFNGIGPRNAGHYTALNRGYAMTTVAHNTLVVDGKSDFEGVTPFGLPHSPEVIAFKGDGSDFQYMAAVDSTAYPGVRMERWVAMVTVPFLESPLIADILIADSGTPHMYDYPLHYSGQMIDINVTYRKALDNMKVLGDGYGYQHLWLEAEAEGNQSTTTYTWLDGGRFYSVSTATTPDSKVMHLRTGANDQDFYLRHEPVYLIREHADKHVFASCLESHGSYREQDEQCVSPSPKCEKIVVERGTSATVVSYQFAGGHCLDLTVSGKVMTENFK